MHVFYNIIPEELAVALSVYAYAAKYERRLSFSLLASENVTESCTVFLLLCIMHLVVYSCWNVLFVQQIKRWHFGILQFSPTDGFGTYTLCK